MTRLLRMIAWLTLAAIVFVTVSPIGYRPHDIVSTNFDRAAAYAVLSALFVIAYPRHLWAVAVLVTAIAGGVELLQWLAPTRHPGMIDVVVKAAGGLVGILVGALLHTGVRHFLARLNLAWASNPPRELRSTTKS